MSRKLIGFVIVVSAGVSLSFAAPAGIKPSHRHEAAGNKAGQYIQEGFFVGGERSVTAARLKDIRRAKSSEGYERIVLDLAAETEDKDALPFFQVQTSFNEGRLVLSIWANVTYDYDAARIFKAFRKSQNIKRLNVLPRVEEGLSIVEFVLDPAKSKKAKVEVFRLARPPRIIMDIL